ncbi:GNAT family N-acetyltransferase [Pelagibius sp. 7325]|uniref:GNAT family N-acetyltransferase n=1 Tax=Pelagibius sp. 7325 TaxID=3131994 RepID=UPI0030EEBFAF
MSLGKLLPRYRIRRGRPADAAGLSAVHERAVRVLGRRVYSDTQIESWVHGNGPARYVEAMRDEGEIFEVAVARLRGIVGFCSLKGEEVRSLYVDPDWTRLRVGSALLARAEALIAEQGHGKVVVGASLAGLPFYEQHGYRVLKHRHWRSHGGLMIPAADMEKPIDEMLPGERLPRRAGRRG